MRNDIFRNVTYKYCWYNLEQGSEYSTAVECLAYMFEGLDSAFSITHKKVEQGMFETMTKMFIKEIYQLPKNHLNNEIIAINWARTCTLLILVINNVEIGESLELKTWAA